MKLTTRFVCGNKNLSVFNTVKLFVPNYKHTGGQTSVCIGFPDRTRSKSGSAALWVATITPEKAMAEAIGRSVQFHVLSEYPGKKGYPFISYYYNISVIRFFLP